VSSLITSLAAVLGLFAGSDSSRQALKSALLALKAAIPGARAQLADIKVALVALFGRGNPILENFGLNVAPRRKLTSTQLAASKAKAAATRVLRGTQGKRKKASVKYLGTVDVQASLAGTPAASGNAPPTGTNPSTAGAPTGAPPAGGVKAPGSGGPSQP
jgi:outer membrane protein TolC